MTIEVQTLFDALRVLDALLCLTLGVWLVWWYAHPRRMVQETRLAWMLTSYWLFVGCNALTDLLLLGDPPDFRLPLRLIAVVTGLAALWLTTRHRGNSRIS
jgi:hypothetical protein